MSTPIRIVIISAAVVVVAVLAVLVFTGVLFPGLLGGSSSAPTVTVPITSDDTARAFATAYASGDTPTACALATDQARQTLDSTGLCTNKAGWNATTWVTRTCTLPERVGGISYEFATSSEVNRFPGFEVVVTGSGDSWRVTKLLSQNGQSLCSIYAG